MRLKSRGGCRTYPCKAAADAKEYAKRAESSADMNRKQALLAAKQDVIRSVLEDAYSQVMNMDDAAYFEMLGKMLDKYMLAPGWSNLLL